jgi:hypothetical protein
MDESSPPMPRSAKIVLGIGLIFFVIVIICFSVGGPLYIQEHHRVKFYEKDSCRVRSASYETIRKCITDGTKTARYNKCYVPLWQVEFGQNGTRRETIRTDKENSYQNAETKSDQYKVWTNNLSMEHKNGSNVSIYTYAFYRFIFLIIQTIKI